MFWFINLCVFVFDIVMTYLLSFRAYRMFKQRYPGLTIPKRHWSEAIVRDLKMVITFLIPILNLVYGFVLLYNDDEICERTIAKVYRKCVEREV